jgi:predicted ester cyclase
MWNQFDDHLRARDLQRIGDTLHPDFSYQLSDLRLSGRAAYLRCLAAWLETFPDMRYDEPHKFAHGDLLVVEAIFHGTQTGPICFVDGSIAQPSGRLVAMPSLSIGELTREGLLRAFRKYLDVTDLAAQMGLSRDELRRTTLWCDAGPRGKAAR